MSPKDQLKSLNWYSIEANTSTGKVGKAELPTDMTIGEALGFIGQTVKDKEGHEYRLGAIASWRGRLQITAFPNNGNGKESMQLS